MSNSLKGKTAFVTGSTRGIGRAILNALANEGCNVIIHFHKNKIDLQNTLRGINTKVKKTIYSGDITKEKEVKELFEKIKKEHGKLDILVNNVGNYIKKDLDKLSISEWHEMLDSNLNSAFYCIHHSLPLLKKSKSGRIINIGYASSGNIVAKPKILPYFIAKTGLLLMTKAYAQTEAKNKILINMISPGVIENSIHFPQKEIPLKRTGKLKGFAELVIQTIKSDYTTGTNIEYAGGFNL